jgi:hypothetical protein
MSTYDADMMATLTPEERAVIEADDLSPDEVAAMQRIAGDGEGDDDDDGDSQANAAPIEGRGAAPDDDADESAAEPAQARQSSAPRYEAPLPADYEARVQEIIDREAELKRQFRSGEMEFDDFEAQRSELLTEREGLTIARAKAEISQEMTAQSAQQAWQSSVNNFLAVTAQDGGLNYRADPEKFEDLDNFVKTLAAKPGNADKPMEWFLTEAHKRVQALHGLSRPTPTPTPTNKPGNTRRTAPVDAIPQTLANVPGGDGPGDVEGEFADVMALDGMEYESAIARMTPGQRERFLRSA